MKAPPELFRSLIDYAGLFPPAGQGMEAAVRDYSRYRTGDRRWMLGRFVVPASRLEEFDRAALPLAKSADPWPLSVLVGDDLAGDLSRVRDFRRRGSASDVETLELRAGTSEEIRSAARALGREITVYYEIPLADPQDGLLEAIRDSGGRAKIRTGGTKPGLVPSVADLARFLTRCLGAQPRTAFKATAGLHHALRSRHPLTYEPGCATDVMHGFLNLFVAASFSFSGLDRLVPGILEEEDPRRFTFAEKAVSWQNGSVTAEALAVVRSWAGSFGSCSFEEPVRDLEELGLI